MLNMCDNIISERRKQKEREDENYEASTGMDFRRNGKQKQTG